MSDKNTLLLLSKREDAILNNPKVKQKYEKYVAKKLISSEFFVQKEDKKVCRVL